MTTAPQTPAIPGVPQPLDTMQQIRNIVTHAAYGPGISASYRETYSSKDGKTHLTYTVVVRDGATADMVRETKRHYLAAALQAAHANTDFPADKITEYSQRTPYDFHYSHAQPRVQLWGEIPVSILNGTVKTHVINVNIMTETTTAVDLLAHIRMVAETVFVPDEPAQPEPLPNAPVTPPQAIPIPNAPTTPPQVAPLQSPPPSAPNMTGFTPQYYSQNGTPHFAEFPRSENKDKFGAAYNGQVTSFTMHRIVKAFDSKTGKPEYQFFEDRNNYTDRWPSVRTTTDYVQDEATKAYLDGLSGTEWRGDWRVVVYVNQKPSRTDSAKLMTYFNVNKVEVQTAANSVQPEPEPVSDVPF